MDIQKKEEYSVLFSYYGTLLPIKSKSYFEMYYNDDYSLGEIASLYNVSRNAIYDSLKKTMAQLDCFESLLKLNEKQELRLKLYDKINQDNYKNIVSKLKEMEND
jgi:predicted DNA-binding protein YlxM (UPF0122 family)